MASSSHPTDASINTAQVGASVQQSSSSVYALQMPSANGVSHDATPVTVGDPSPTEDAGSDDENGPSGKKKSRLTNFDRRDICIYQRDTPGVRQEDIAKKWGVERSTISKILKEKQRWLAIPADETVEIVKARLAYNLSSPIVDATKAKCSVSRPPKFEDIEHKLKDWLLTKVEVGSSVSDKDIHDKALEFAKGSSAATAKFKASHGWIDGFKVRHGIRKGIWLGYGTSNEKDRALGNGHANLPDPLESLGPTMMDDLYRTGTWDPNAAAQDIVYEIPIYKVPIKQVMEKHGGRGWHELTQEERDASTAAGDNDFYPHYEMMKQETQLEDECIAEAQDEAIELQAAAMLAGEPFDFKSTFDRLVREKLAVIDYESVDVPEFDVPPIPGHHPDDIEPTPGPSGERALESIWEIIRFCMPRRGRVFSNAHCAVLLEIWARITIISERQRRAVQRQSTYKFIYERDKENDVKHAADMIAEKERDFALNPTGEPTGRDIVARQTRKEDLEHLKEMQSAHDELVSDPKASDWLDQVHNAQREEAPSVTDDAPEPSGTTPLLEAPPPQPDPQLTASSSQPLPPFLPPFREVMPGVLQNYDSPPRRMDRSAYYTLNPPPPVRVDGKLNPPEYAHRSSGHAVPPEPAPVESQQPFSSPGVPLDSGTAWGGLGSSSSLNDPSSIWTGALGTSLQQVDPNPAWMGAYDPSPDIDMAGPSS